MSDTIAQLQSRPRDKVKVTLTGGRFFTVPVEQAAVLSVGLELTDTEIKRLADVDAYFRGKEKAARMLSLRARTKREVRDALASMEIPEAIARGIVSELEEIGLLDDRRFAAEYVRTKVDVRFMGPHRLRADLSKLGVPRDVIDAVLADEAESGDQEARARALVEKKTRGQRIDERVVRRVAGMLRRKGYDYEVVNRISYELLRKSGSDSAVEEL